MWIRLRYVALPKAVCPAALVSQQLATDRTSAWQISYSSPHSELIIRGWLLHTRCGTLNVRCLMSFVEHAVLVLHRALHCKEQRALACTNHVLIQWAPLAPCSETAGPLHNKNADKIRQHADHNNPKVSVSADSCSNSSGCPTSCHKSVKLQSNLVLLTIVSPP